jgi:hypothetical protein
MSEEEPKGTVHEETQKNQGKTYLSTLPFMKWRRMSVSRRVVGEPRSPSLSIFLFILLWTSTVMVPFYISEPVAAFPANQDPDAKLTGGGKPTEIKIIDINYDSLPDIVTVNDNGNDISFFFQRANRTFNATPDASLFIGETPASAVLEDLDRDGLIDIVAIDHGCFPWPLDCNTTIFYQRPDYSYPAIADQVIGRSDIVPAQLAVGDYNSDGLPDFAMSGGLTGRIFVYLQLTSGGFPDDPDWILSTLDMAALGLVRADLNDDGLDDLVLANHDSWSVSLYYQKSNHTLPLVPDLNLSSGDGPTYVTPGDLNGDDLIDLAVTNGMEGTFSLFYQRRNYTFPTSPDQKISTGGTGNFVPIHAAIGDVNEDSMMDIVVSRATKTITHVYLQNVSGGFPPSPSFILNAPGSVCSAIGDLDGDYLDDIAVCIYREPLVNETIYLFYQEPPRLPPVTTLSIGFPKIDDTLPLVTSSTPLSFDVVDRSGLGIDSTYYRINSGPWWVYQSGTTFNLPDEGPNKIDFYSVDNASSVETAQTRYVAVDNTPPASMFSAGDPHVQLSALWVSPSTDLSLSATDGPTTSAGVNSTSYRIWNSSGWSQWLQHSNPFRLNDEEGNILEFSSEDRLGNVESIQNVSMMVDGTPPTTFASAPFLLNGSRALSFASIDLGVGASSTQFSLDGNPWQDYTEVVYLPGDVDHQVLYQSEDLLGNLEAEKSLLLPKATPGPLTFLQVGDPKHGAFPAFVTSSTLLTLDPVDRSGSGINKTLYSIDGGQWMNYSGSFALSGEGIHQISFYSIDNLSQDGAINVATLVVDDTGPDVAILSEAGSHVVRDGSRFATSTSTFSFESNDRGALSVGTAEVEYQLWTPSGWSPMASFSTPFFLGEPEGERYIRYHGVDLLGNVGVVNNDTVLVDDTPPYSTLEWGSPRYSNCVGPYTPLTVVSTDAGPMPVGLSGVEYRFDSDTAWVTYSSPTRLEGLQDGPHDVRYRGTDLLGNVEVEKTASVILDGSPPVTTMPDIPAHITRETILFLSATDSGSGVNFTQYKIDNNPWMIYADGFALDEGEHDIFYKSVDNLGNVEDENHLHVIVKEAHLVEDNYKPLVAVVFAIILAILGLFGSWRRPWEGKEGRIPMLKTFAFVSIPFILAEAVTGIISHFTGELSIPPPLGLGTVVDVVLLLAGLSTLVYWLRVRGKSKDF